MKVPEVKAPEVKAPEVKVPEPKAPDVCFPWGSRSCSVNPGPLAALLCGVLRGRGRGGGSLAGPGGGS